MAAKRAPRKVAHTAAPARVQAPLKSVYVLKATLLDVRPPVWRELHVYAGTRLDELHLILQAAFGWMNSHLHEFSLGEARYGRRDPTGDLFEDVFGTEEDLHDEQEHFLFELAPRAGITFGYVYDFGDSWEHAIRVVKRIAPKPGVKYPTCVAGARAAPPEDCGGPPGYEELLEILADPSREEHEEMLEWVGGRFDPEAFSLRRTDRAVRRALPVKTGGWVPKTPRRKKGRKQGTRPSVQVSVPHHDAH